MSQTSLQAQVTCTEAANYDDFLTALQTTFDRHEQNGAVPLFSTDMTDPLEIFLSQIPAADRQYFTCRACSRFLRRYGGLVTIDSNGKTTSVLWDETEVAAYFAPAVIALRTQVQAATVVGPFLSSATIYGTPEAGGWTHMAVQPSAKRVHKANRVDLDLAVKRQDYDTMQRALTEFRLPVVNTALALLESESLYRADRFLGVAKWLQALLIRREQVRAKQARDNLLWLAVATAPGGYCHPRSSMIGTLLVDIADGLDFPTIKRRFDAKMDGTLFQRPQVAPAQQNILRAEALVEELGLAPSLQRRFLRLDEVVALWRPKPKPASTAGVFAHLKAKALEAAPINLHLGPVATTVEKFRRTVLPNADCIQLKVPRVNANYTALLTAVHPEAPPILQWDREDQRNTVSWYVYDRGSPAMQWGLSQFFSPVTAVTALPPMWTGQRGPVRDGMIFLLEGAKDASWAKAGAALFPEILRAELHEVRATIESYSRGATVSGYDESSACGIVFEAGNSWQPVTFRVTSGNTVTDYLLDRWD